MRRIVAPLHFHDLGKLLLALVMLWSYFAFSQYLIIWSGNLPEEIGWYIVRTHDVWGVVIVAIAILHFAAPFLFLLSRDLKRNPRKLVLIAMLILVMRMVDLLWMLVPAFREEHKWIWMDVIALIGFGGLWLALFTWQLGKRSLIPINDPQFESVMEQMHAADIDYGFTQMTRKEKSNGHKTETPDVSHIRNVEVTHETSDVNVRGVLTFVVVLASSTIAVCDWRCGCCSGFSTSSRRKSPGRDRWRLTQRGTAAS